MKAMLANLKKAETDARALLEVGEISKADLTALQIQFSADALARRDALTQAQQARGQLEDALQIPTDLLPSAEISPRPAPLKTVVADNDSVNPK